MGDDTDTNVKRLCSKAMHPVRPDLLEALGASELGITTGAVCVYNPFVKTAVRALEGSGVPVTGFFGRCAVIDALMVAMVLLATS